MDKETFIATVNHIIESGCNDIRLADLYDRLKTKDNWYPPLTKPETDLSDWNY